VGDIKVKVHSDHVHLSGSTRERVRTFRVRVLLGKEILMERNYHAPHFAMIANFDGVARGERDAREQTMKHFASRFRERISRG